jgi:hypothetical protein
MGTSLVLTTRNAQVKQAFYRRTDPTAPLAPRQFVVGLVQHPHTGLFQVWISTNGLDIISVSAHRRIMDAETDVKAIKAVLGSQDIYNERKVAALIQQLATQSDEPPCPLPDDLVRQMCRAILRTVVHQPPPAEGS